jgi:hypothetical protein
MANICWNLFSFYGNETVTEQVKKWQEGLDSIEPTEDDKYCMRAIHKIFYSNIDLEEEIDFGSKWVHQDKNSFSPEKNQLGFQSAWSSPNELQKHLTLLLHKLDKNVLVENSYNMEDSSMGYVYSAVNETGEICIEVAHAELNLDDFESNEDADSEQQELLNEWQEDTVTDLIQKVPAIAEVVKKNLPHLEIDWEHLNEDYS